MFLHTGNLYWPGTYEQAPMFPALEEDIRCDVLIVGGGISGAYSAYHLAETGLDIVVIDKRRVGSGSTSANTGLLQFSNDKTLTSCIHSFGEEKAVRHYKLCEQVVSDINSIVPTLPIDVDFIPRNSLYMASCHEDVSLLKEEYAALRKHGFAVEYWTDKQTKEKYGFEKPAALYTKGDAEVNPYKLTYALIQKAAESGVRVYEHTSVIGKTFEDGHVNLLTNTKCTIHLKNLFPQYAGAEAEFFWAGVFGDTHDGLPIIGAYDDYPHCYFLLGYGGNGVVYSGILGKMLKEVLTEGSHPEFPVYMDKRPLFQ